MTTKTNYSTLQFARRMSSEYPEYTADEFYDMLKVLAAVMRQELSGGSTINISGLATFGTKTYEKTVVGRLEGQTEGIRKLHTKLKVTWSKDLVRMIKSK